NASLLFIVNSTNITSRNLNESVYNGYGVDIRISSNILIADARLMGYYAVYFSGSVNLTLVNISFLSESTSTGLYLYNLLGFNGSFLFQFTSPAWISNSYIINSTGTGLQGYSSTNVNVTNVTV